MARSTAVSTLVLVAACAAPRHDGPQLLDPPRGFAYDPRCSAARLVFADRAGIAQVCYYTRGDPPDWITLTTFEGTATAADAGAAREALRMRYPGEEYGEIEAMTIDGRPAWAWLETQAYQGKTASVEMKAIVAYPDRTYSVEFSAHDPAHRDPEFLKRVVRSFAVRYRGDFDASKALALLAVAAAGIVGVRHLRRLQAQDAAARAGEPPRPPRRAQVLSGACRSGKTRRRSLRQGGSPWTTTA